jgi:hypothetical protein
MDKRLRRKILAAGNKISYQEKDLLGGWVIEVRQGLVHIGNIRKIQMSGELQYYLGSNNQLNPTFKGFNLDALKQSIEASEA